MQQSHSILKTESPIKKRSSSADPKSPENSRRLSFNNDVKSHTIHFNDNSEADAAVSALLSAANNTQQNNSFAIFPIFETDSGNSYPSDGSIISLADSESSPNAQIDTQLKQLVKDQIHRFAINYFPKNIIKYEFASRLIRSAFYQTSLVDTLEYLVKKSNKKNTSQLTNSTEEQQPPTFNQIRESRLITFERETDVTRKWLQKVSFNAIFEAASKNARKYYLPKSSNYLLFEQYLLVAIESLGSTLASYESIDDLFFSEIKPDNLKKDFEEKLEFMTEASTHHYKINTFESMLLTQFLVLNYYKKPLPTTETVNIDSTYDEYQTIPDILGLTNQLKLSFELKLATIINALPAAIPLWQTWYMLRFYGPKLFVQFNPDALTKEKFKQLYTTSNQNNGQKGVTLMQELMSALPATLSNNYFKPDSNDKKYLILKTREDLMQDSHITLNLRLLLEVCAHLGWASFLLTDILTATETIKAPLTFEAVSYPYFAVLTLICLVVGCGLTRARVITQREATQTLEIFSLKNGPQVFQPPQNNNDVVNPLYNNALGNV